MGFRYTTVRIARRFEVAGYVRNLADGRVQVVAEAAPEDLDRFLEAIGRELNRFISGSQSRAGRATGEFIGFGIRYG